MTPAGTKVTRNTSDTKPTKRNLFRVFCLLAGGVAALRATSKTPVNAQTLQAQTVNAQNASKNQGSDFWFGGPEQFAQLRDVCFDARGNLYALDGFDARRKTGNLRVQKFDRAGTLLQTFDLRDESTGAALGEANDPQRVAADARGRVYVSQPKAGIVMQFAPDGKYERAIAIPNAMAITIAQVGGQERVAVVPSRRAVVKGKWTWLGGANIILLRPDSGAQTSLALPQLLQNVQDVTTDKSGNFYLQAEPNAIYKVSPSGALLKTFGGNPTTRNPDGSEVLHTVAVDSRDNVYTYTWGNPGRVTRFDPGGNVTQRGGQWKWADAWSVQSAYTILAIDPDDRLWVGVTTRQNPNNPNFAKYHPVPAVTRVEPDFFASSNKVTATPGRILGFAPQLSCALPYNVAYNVGEPIPMRFRVGAARRNVSTVTVKWRAFDALKTSVAQGRFSLPLENGKEASADFSFTPSRFGSYFVIAQASSPDGELGAWGELVGVTPRFPKMPTLAPDESKGGWTDAPRQMWTGLPLMRVHPNAKKLDEAEAQIALAERYGATYFLQLTDKPKTLSLDDVRAVAERFKSRHPMYEVSNEPNFSMNADEYTRFHKSVYETIKAVDPQAQVMGPGVVNLDLKWLTRFYELGGKSVTDAISLHDYEGHESISPEHWSYKFAQIRAIMAANGDANKPLWQTERAIASVRGNNFQGLVGAIRTTLHRDLLESLGVPTQHNAHYYLNEGGYSSVPSYAWSSHGPLPAAFALRTRAAQTSALGRRFLRTLDFGTPGNDLFFGVVYGGADGETVSLRNLGTSETPLDFAVRGTRALDVADAWGNASQVPVVNGRARLILSQLPIYVRLPTGATLSPPPMNFGRDLALSATIAYSGATSSDADLLTNGVLETYHFENPRGGTNGKKIWTGDFDGAPQTLTLELGKTERIGRVVVRGVRADNQFCALLSYDLQAETNGVWKTLAQVRRPMPASEAVRTSDASHAVWMDDTNFFMHSFAPVSTRRLRLVVQNVTHGFVPDAKAQAWSKTLPQKLMLREIGVYGQ